MNSIIYLESWGNRMKSKKYLFLIIFFTFTLKNITAKVINGIYEIPRTTIAPEIDGQQDAVWKTLDWNFQRIYTVDGIHADSGKGLTGMSKAMWDVENLYILFYSLDNFVSKGTAIPECPEDLINIYIDPDNSKIPDGTPPDTVLGLIPSDIQLTIRYSFKGSEDENIGNIGFPPGMSTEGVKFKIADDDTLNGLGGWWVEMKIPLNNIHLLSVPGTEIGWELEQYDSDSCNYPTRSRWWSNSINIWTDASLWGTAVLSSRTVDSVLEIEQLYDSHEIVIDGKMDEYYKYTNPITMNYYKVDGLISDVMFDAFLTVYPLWDYDNLYLFFDVIDDDIEDGYCQTSCWYDAINLFIDSDNSKIPDGIKPDPGPGLAPGDIQLTIPHKLIGIEDESLSNIDLPTYISTDGIKFRIANKEDGGWCLELKIPLKNIDINPYPGSSIGFEIELLDQDFSGILGMESWWSNSDRSWTDANLWGIAMFGSRVIDGVQEIKTGKTFKLYQNYPNPFNPNTTISYQLSVNCYVTLKIFNTLGQEVEIITNEFQNAGYHSVLFSPHYELPSGIYFYQIRADDFVVTKKLVLLK
jgi:hypothetical protein